MPEVAQGAPVAPTVETPNQAADASKVTPETSKDGSSESSADEDLSSEAEISEAEENGEISKKEAQALKKKLKLNVKGKTKELELDLSNDEELTKYMQKALSFDENAKELSTTKNQVAGFLEQLKQDPEAVLEALGIDVTGMSEKRIRKMIEDAEKSPEQKEREDMQKKIRDYEKKEKELEEKAEKAEQESILNKHASEIQNQIIEALETSSTKLPKRNPKVLSMVAQTMKQAMKMGFDNVAVKDIIPIVEKRWTAEIQEFLSELPEDVIEDVIGKHNYKRVHAKKLEAYKKRQAKSTETPKQILADTGVNTKNQSKEVKKVSMKDFFKD